MYIRRASRVYKTYFNYLLVESVLTPQGPRQKVVCSLGDLSPRPEHEWLALAHKLQSALGGQQDLFPSAKTASPLDPLLAKAKSSAAVHLLETTGDSEELLPFGSTACLSSSRAKPARYMGVSVFGNAWGWRRFSRARA